MEAILLVVGVLCGDYRSCLFRHVPRVVGLCQTRFKRAQVHKLVENVASMDFQDCQVMNEASDELPWHIDSLGVSLCRRPPLCWVSWQLLSGDGVDMTWGDYRSAASAG